ncbi:MAG TPA: LamG-like jellyroll fold domain-containing protein, partial [Cytophagaceae bacterium]
MKFEHVLLTDTMKESASKIIFYLSVILLLLSGAELQAACTSITTQPASTTICSGVNTTFAIVTAGGSTTYQWQVSKDGGTTWTNLTNVLPYSTVTTATMNITGTPAVMNGYKFRCSLNGSCGFSSAVSLTVSASTVQVPIANFVAHYPFNGNANDESGSLNAGTLQAAPTLTTDRFGIANKAYLFNGTSQYVSTSNLYSSPNNFTISIWFKTTSTSGGKLIGFGNSQSATSSAYDRHIYMSAAGQLYYGVSYATLKTPSAYNDGIWHQVTGTMSSTNGMKLYVDGELIVSNAGTTSGQAITGYWKIGFDNLAAWLDAGNSYFAGSLDDVYIYSTELTATQVLNLSRNAYGASNDGPGCSGTTINFAAPTLSGATYSWTGPNSFSSTSQNPAITNISSANNGIYTLTTTQSGCTFTSYTLLRAASIYNTISCDVLSLCSSNTPSIITGTPSGGNGTYTYQWQSSTTSSTTDFANISGATSVSYTPSSLSQTTWFRRIVTSNLCTSTSAALKITVYGSAPGTPSVFGNNLWNIYSYSDNNFSTYAGYYTESSLTFNSNTKWGESYNPSIYSDYSGCVVGNDQFSLSAKRTNFTAGTYQIDLSHDDDISLYINGVMVASQSGIVDVSNAWTGTLGPTTEIELRLKEGYGGARLAPTFTSKTAATGVTAGTLSGTATICSGSTAALTGTVGASTPTANACYMNYQWQSSSNNSTWSNISSATSQNYTTTALTSTTYFRRVDTDACGNTATTNTITITVNPVLTMTTSIAASSTLICAGTSTTFTATTVNGGTASPAAPLAYDDFNTTPGALEAKTSGSGWEKAWYVQNSDVTVPGYNVSSSSPMTYSTLKTTGNYAIGGYAYLSAGRMIDVGNAAFAPYLSSGLIGASGTTMYISALMRKDVNYDDELSLQTHSNWIECFATENATGMGYFGSSSNTSGVRYWSLKVNGAVIQTTVPVSVGTTALLVMKITFGATNTISLFVNPSSIGSAEPAAILTTTTTSAVAFKAIAFYGGNSINQSSIDEIRIASSYASATPTTSSLSYQWQLNNTNISGATNSTYTTSTLASGDAIKTIVTSVASCLANSTATSNILTATSGQWLGTTSNAWNTASNWCGGIPALTTDVVIPSGTPNSPEIASAGASAKNLTVNSGATLTLASG